MDHYLFDNLDSYDSNMWTSKQLIASKTPAKFNFKSCPNKITPVQNSIPLINNNNCYFNGYPINSQIYLQNYGVSSPESNLLMECLEKCLKKTVNFYK